MTIESFTGKYAVLAPDYEVNFYCEEDDTIYPTIQHAFEACKTDAPCKKRWLAELPLKKAKIATRKWKRWPDWPKEKLFCMRALLRDKFTLTPNASEYAEVLLSTGDEELVFTGKDADTYWGIVKGEGENHLGKLLMEVRKELNSNG
jgi:predicted NAD-dependent protein-ADP-ribosyltransferase YbiA (DUF1768 family)